MFNPSFDPDDVAADLIDDLAGSAEEYTAELAALYREWLLHQQQKKRKPTRPEDF